jgi:hypothetical protein
MSEAIYNEQIAPKLAEIGRLCEQHGMSFVAAVEYQPGSLGETRVLAGEVTFAPLLVSMAIQACGNVDKLMLNAWEYARAHGHTSVVLSVLDRAGEE